MPGYEATQWFGLSIAGGKTTAIVERLAQETARAVGSPELKEHIFAEGLQSVGSTPAELSTYPQPEIAKWAKVAKAASIKVE